MTTPHLLCILDGFGWGPRDDGNAIHLAHTPTWDRLLQQHPWCLLTAHGEAVGMPSNGDMGNSEVGHNAMGAGRVFDQGAKLVQAAFSSGRVWDSPSWQAVVERCITGGTLHLLGLVSDGNVHSHVDHLHALIERAAEQGIASLRVHMLTDGRDVAPRSALTWVGPLEDRLAQHRADGLDYAVATGGGRMRITMDRYEADWDMVARGWAVHVRGEGERFDSAVAAVDARYTDTAVDDQWLEPFVVGDYTGMKSGDATVFFNFRGDRAIEISRAFDEGDDFDGFDRGERPDVLYVGMMEYDGDTHVPRHTLVEPPAITGTVSEHLAAAGIRAHASSETQKYGHVTYFFNGNRSEVPPGETRLEVPSDPRTPNTVPEMKAEEVVTAVVHTLEQGEATAVRINLANGDMVGHTGDLPAAVRAIEVLDAQLARLVEAAEATGTVLLITADHGNVEEMVRRNKKTGALQTDSTGRFVPSTSHSLNPVPFVLVDPTGSWRLTADTGPVEAGSIARVGATVLTLAGVPVPDSYLPSLVEPA